MAVVLPVLTVALLAESALHFESVRELELFFFPAEEERVFDSMKQVFRLDNPGALVSAAAKVGPGYATKVAAALVDPGYRLLYMELAHYLDLFGPCQKEQSKEAEGWWSGYGPPPKEGYCAEVTKLIFANTLATQVYYCRRLATGADKPHLGPKPGHEPPYRLDEVPVKTHWLNTEALYQLGAEAERLKFHQALWEHAKDKSTAHRQALIDAAVELQQQPVNPELAALALAYALVRNYESVHLGHLARYLSKPD